MKMGMSKRRNWKEAPTNVISFDEASARTNRERQKSPDRPPKLRQETWDFYKTRSWLRMRYRALKKHGGRCQCCGRSAKDGVILQVDHIKPRSKYPELELRLSNLQVLCGDCNQGKSNKDETDWR